MTELPPALQRKLLRAIERGEVCRVRRTDRWLKVDVRVIATTRRDSREVEAGRFREDLYLSGSPWAGSSFHRSAPPWRRRGAGAAFRG